MHLKAFHIKLQVLARCLCYRPPSASVSHSEHVARLCQRVSLPARASARPHRQAGRQAEAFDVIERHSASAKSIFHVNDCAAPPLASWNILREISGLNLGEWRVWEAHWQINLPSVCFYRTCVRFWWPVCYPSSSSNVNRKLVQSYL